MQFFKLKLNHDNQFGECWKKIKELREDKNLTQQEVADYLNIDRSNYSKYERGVLIMTPEMIRQLCRLYDISADFIIGLTNI